MPYLRDLALVVAIGAITDSLLDYVLKSQAASAFSRGSQLMSFFAIINTVFGLLSLVVQAGLARSSLRTLGLAGTVAVRPATILVVALLGLVDPRMWAAILARAGQDINTSSLFRSGYELLFTPLPEAEKRPTKAVVDVGFDKLGSLVGGAVAALLWGCSDDQNAERDQTSQSGFPAPLRSFEGDENALTHSLYRFEIRTRRRGSVPTLDEASLYCSANWCWSRRM